MITNEKIMRQKTPKIVGKCQILLPLFDFSDQKFKLTNYYKFEINNTRVVVKKSML